MDYIYKFKLIYSMETEKKETLEYKIIIIGEQGVGKTYILKNLLGEELNDEVSTTGPTYMNKEYTFSNCKISLNIWDTAGQEKFRSLQRIFFNNTDAAILVYDVTNSNSLEGIKSFWLQEVKENCPESLSK